MFRNSWYRVAMRDAQGDAGGNPANPPAQTPPAEKDPKFNPDGIFNHGFGAGAGKERTSNIEFFNQIANLSSRDSDSVNNLGRKIFGDTWETTYKPTYTKIFVASDEGKDGDKKSSQSVSKEMQQQLEIMQRTAIENARLAKETENRLIAENKTLQIKFALKAIADQMPNLKAKNYVIDDYLKNREFEILAAQNGGDSIIQPRKSGNTPIFSEMGTQKDLKMDFFDFISKESDMAKECLGANPAILQSPGAHAAMSQQIGMTTYTDEQITEMNLKNPKDPNVRKITDEHYARKYGIKK